MSVAPLAQVVKTSHTQQAPLVEVYTGLVAQMDDRPNWAHNQKLPRIATATETLQVNRERLQFHLNGVLALIFPKELLPMIRDYVLELPHVWNSTAWSQIYARVSENTVTGLYSYHRNLWTRVVSERSVFEGPSKWRLRIKFPSPYGSGYVAVGVSRASKTDIIDLGTGLLGTINFLQKAASSTEYLVYTGNRQSWPKQMLKLNDGKSEELVHEVSQTDQVVVDVEFIAAERVLVVSQRVRKNWKCISHKLGPEIPNEVWRPCVAVSGDATVTIVPWETVNAVDRARDYSRARATYARERERNLPNQTI